jgi:hypothetical protein
LSGPNHRKKNTRNPIGEGKVNGLVGVVEAKKMTSINWKYVLRQAVYWTAWLMGGAACLEVAGWVSWVLVRI